MFGREYHKYKFIETLDNGERFIVVRGERWSGKSYFIQNTINEIGMPYIYIDIEKLHTNKTGGTVFDRLKRDSLGNQSNVKTNIEDLSFIGNSDNFVDFFGMLNDKFDQVIVVLDHADAFHQTDYYRRILSWVVDELYNVIPVLVSKSELKLEKFLSIHDYSSEFFGRDVEFLDIDYFDSDSSIAFLRENSMDISIEEAVMVYDTLGGSPVWLRRYLEYREKFKKEALSKTLKDVRDVIYREIGRSKWNILVLQNVAKRTLSGQHIGVEALYNDLECDNGYCQKETRNTLLKLISLGYIKYIGKDVFSTCIPAISFAFSGNVV